MLATAAAVFAFYTITTVGAAPQAQAVRRAAAAAPAPDAALLKQYCVTCHNERVKAGALSLAGLDVTAVDGHAEVWEKVVRKLRTGAMPPQGVRRPDQATYDRLIASRC